MDLLTSKLISITVLGVLTLFFGLIPLKVQKRLMRPTGVGSELAQRRKRELIVSCLLCFGAGVLMATVFLHMLPETRENVELTYKTMRMAEETAYNMNTENETHFQGLKLGHGHEEHDHDHAEHRHVYKRSVNSSLETIRSNTTTPTSITASNFSLNQDSVILNDKDTHTHDDHAHDDHTHDKHTHDDHTHDDHTHDDHTHDDHTHDDHTHDDHTHDDHSHNHSTNSHNHADHDESHDLDHSHDHGGHNHSHEHDHNEAAPASLPSGLSPSSTGVPQSVPREDPVTLTPVVSEEIPHVHDHDHDHAGDNHAGHIHEGHDQMPSSTAASIVPPSSVIDDAKTIEGNTGDQPQRDHRGHLHDHDLTHGPYDRTQDNLEHVLKPSKMGDSKSLSFVPHARSNDNHDHSHDDHNHSGDAHTRHDHEEINARIQDRYANNPNNGTYDGHADHDHDPASPIKVHVHDDHHDHDHGDDTHLYPIAELLICLGFFLIYFIEEIVHKVVFHKQQRSHSKRDPMGGAGSMVLTNRNSSLSPIKEQKGNSSITSNGVEGIFRPTAPHSAENDHAIANGNGYAVNDAVASGGMNNGSMASMGSLPPRVEWGTTGVDNPVFSADGETEGPQMTSTDYTNNSNVGHGHSHLADFNKLKASDWVSSLRSLIVVVALSFHSVFEGLAVGLQQQMQDVWYLLYAIAAHKLVIAFCVGLELIAGGTRTALTIVYMVVLALVTPLGIAIGIIISEATGEPNSLSHRWTLTIMQGLAGGTLLYVTFCEVLERERGRKEGRFVKLAALIIGFTTMAVIEALGQHKHTH